MALSRTTGEILGLLTRDEFRQDHKPGSLLDLMQRAGTSVHEYVQCVLSCMSSSPSPYSSSIRSFA